MKRAVAAVSVLALCAPLPGCTSEPDDRTPEGALQIFLAAVQYASVDPEGNAEAWKLLDHGTQERLRARARRASELSGARFTGPEMIAVPFAAHVAALPRVQVRQQGDRATAQIATSEARPASAPATTPTTSIDLVRENGRWRIVLPDPPPAEPGVPTAPSSAPAPAPASAPTPAPPAAAPHAPNAPAARHDR